jgi:excisionase family DNA binding protein
LFSTCQWPRRSRSRAQLQKLKGTRGLQSQVWSGARFLSNRPHSELPMKSEIESSETNRLAFRVRCFCESVGIGRTKFYELVRDGKIKTVIIGGRRLVPADEAQRLVREGCTARPRLQNNKRCSPSCVARTVCLVDSGREANWPGLGRAMSAPALDRRKAEACAACGLLFRPKRIGRRQRYCSYRCRDEARRGRNFAISGQTRPVPKQSHETLKITQQHQGPAKAIFGVEGPLEIVGHGHRWLHRSRSDARQISNAVAAELGVYVLRRRPTDGGDG